MDLISSLNLEQLGTAGLFIGYLIWSNAQLRTDIRTKDAHITELSRLMQESQLESLATLNKLEQAFILLREKVG